MDAFIHFRSPEDSPVVASTVSMPPNCAAENAKMIEYLSQITFPSRLPTGVGSLLPADAVSQATLSFILVGQNLFLLESHLFILCAKINLIPSFTTTER